MILFLTLQTIAGSFLLSAVLIRLYRAGENWLQARNRHG